MLPIVFTAYLYVVIRKIYITELELWVYIELFEIKFLICIA